MASRMDRYSEDYKKPNEDEINSRLLKNKSTYDDLNNKIGFEELINFDTQTRIELTSVKEGRASREKYQQVKDYQDLINPPTKEIDASPEVPEEEKVFDINSILEEARKNRDDKDELENKRKLKNEEYSVLNDLNKKYIQKKEENQGAEEIDELKELIDTITSKPIKEEADDSKDLLSDLIATNTEIEPEDLAPTETMTTTANRTIDKSFYTRSMDLSEEDFDMGEEKKSSGFGRAILILFVILVLLAIIGVVAYFILKSMGIDVDIKGLLNL